MLLGSERLVENNVELERRDLPYIHTMHVGNSEVQNDIEPSTVRRETEDIVQTISRASGEDGGMYGHIKEMNNESHMNDARLHR
jgi:hypothetical protein